MPREPYPSTSRPIQARSLLTVVLLLGLLLAGASWLGPVGDPAARTDPSVVHRVDINRAEAGEIAILRGIGDVLAGRIVENRRTHGPFSDVDDLERVHGIGPRIVEKIRAHVASCSEKP
jgi:competence ComEA-like helix-hairpin-helix protein